MSRIYGTGILRSMALAFKNFFRQPITLQYPYEKMEMPERSRWAVVPKYDDAGMPKCRACMACVRACPSYVLALEATTDPDTKAKHIDEFSYQIGACLLCGLCVESCPFDAIEMSHNYELARISPDDLEYDLLSDVPAASAPKRDAADRPASAKPAADKSAVGATAVDTSATVEEGSDA
jgi:NADH-quinone oxidoreductase subunit I